MSYCLNPLCQTPDDPLNANEETCRNCGSELLLQGRYRVIRALAQGGFARTFELDDHGTPKVLKVLLTDYSKAIELFEREARVLSRLHHSGIPKVEPDGYFTFLPEGASQPLHCLVMEKIEGQNLQEWLRSNPPITQEQALDWLTQLVEILAQVHQQQYFHRDIKPSNIMLRPNGQLALIDFGAVREITETYLRDVEHKDVTELISRGYTPPEQYEGASVPQSDFFALGRTFVHLLTGKHPRELKEPQTGELIWRSSAPQVSESLAGLIDHLMAIAPQYRPANTQVILARLGEGEFSGHTRNDSYSVSMSSPSWHKLRTLLLTGAIATSLIMGVRWLGMLQSWELQAFDQLMRLRSDELPDSRLLVVTINEEDFQLPEQQQRKGSLSDRALALVLSKLAQFKARAIGLDIYHDFPVNRNQADLATLMQQNDSFVAICKVSDPEAKLPGIAPPPGIPKAQQGFSDFVIDADSILRRHLIAMKPPSASPCTTPYALSSRLAFRYLEGEGIFAKYTQKGDLQLGKAVFKRWRSHMGGYQQVDASDYQILLNYRSHSSPVKFAPTVTLTEVLTGKVKPDQVKGRIVLIGVTAQSSHDDFLTPYSANKWPSEKMPGVIAQAQMVSQILSAVLDGRPLLWVWPMWGEVLWVWGWSVVGGAIAWRCQTIRDRGLAGVASLGVLSGLCFGLITQGGWVPLIPSALALITTAGCVITSTRPPNQRHDLDLDEITKAPFVHSGAAKQ